MKHAKTAILLLLLSMDVSSAFSNTVAARPAESKQLRSVVLSRRLDSVPEERDCELEEETKKDVVEEIEFKCKAKSDDGSTEIKDEIKFKIEPTDKGLKVKVEYEQEIETDVSEQETETKYEIVFNQIVEYQKSTSSAFEDAYDWESDAVVQTMMLTNWGQFSNIMDNSTHIVFSIASMDDVAMFTFTINRGGAGESVQANKMKIDFELKNFPWTQDDTYVALLSLVESEREIEVDYEDDDSDDDKDKDETTTPKKSRKTEDVKISFQDVLDATGIVPFGEYTWAKTAVVMSSGVSIEPQITTGDGNNSTEMTPMEQTTISVIATSPPPANNSEGDEDTTAIAYSFVGMAARSAADIYWDPEAGVGYATMTSTSAASASVSSATLFMASLFTMVGASLSTLVS